MSIKSKIKNLFSKKTKKAIPAQDKPKSTGAQPASRPVSKEEQAYRSYPGAREAIARNKEFKDTKKGKRCFILGNGPSLKTEDLTTLAGEDVFTVNQAARHPDFPALRSKFHFWADPNFFVVDEEKPEDMEFIEIMKGVNIDGNRPICFFPYKQIEFIKKHKLDEALDIRYFFFDSSLQEGSPGDIDFCRLTPVYFGVVMWCIALAIYMGYSEIYLLGIDSTSILVNIKSFLKQNDDEDYAYEVSENEKARLERMIARQSLENQARAFFFTLRQYRLLYKYCSDRGITLINCSSSTLVDSIPRKRLVDVLAGK